MLVLKVVYGPLIALLLTSGLIIWLSPLAKSAGLVDKPDARKKHTGEIPLIGGPAIFVAVFAVQQGYLRLWMYFASEIMHKMVSDGFQRVQRFSADWQTVSTSSPRPMTATICRCC